jgi:hypothetical protein
MTSRSPPCLTALRTRLRGAEIELRVNSQEEIVPIYRVGAPVVCAPNSSVEPTDLKSSRLALVAGGHISLDDA